MKLGDILTCHGLGALALATLMAANAACTTVTPAAPATDSAWQEAVEHAIDRYLNAHPEVVEQALKTLDVKRQTEERDRIKAAIANRQRELLHDSSSPVSGNPTGAVTVVEFFDYRCRYCKQAAEAVTQLQRDVPDVRIVYKDFPILGEVSELAARAALASHAQGRHQAFHEALLATTADLTQDEVLRVAQTVGLDTNKLLADMANPEWTVLINRNRNLAGALGIAGTPAFVVGTDIYRGAQDLNSLKVMVKDHITRTTPP